MRGIHPRIEVSVRPRQLAFGVIIGRTIHVMLWPLFVKMGA